MQASDQRKRNVRNVEKEDKGICGVIEKSKGIYAGVMLLLLRNILREKRRKTNESILFFLKDDLGYVCRIFEGSKFIIANASDQDFGVAEVLVHPSHMKQMKPHNIEGFNFSPRIIVCCSPAGCILAHAPGSGKTFMIIKYMQNFLAEYLNAIPLCSREFERWQVEEIPLYDLYTLKADRILFLGYEQVASIVPNSTSSTAAAAFHDTLLKVPTILILDEVLYGSLFKNHVEEVFNSLNLVQPEFLKLDTSKNVLRRITSRVQIAVRKQIKIEETVQNDQDFQRKVTMIQNLCEMRQGGSLDELPGLVGFTVLLTLKTKQKHAVEKMKKLDTFKRSSISRTYKGHINEAKILLILPLCESAGEKMLVFSQYLLPLKFLERLVEQREISGRFNNSKDAKVFFVSIKACWWAAWSPKEEDRHTCFRRELIWKMWFEWSEICGYRNFSNPIFCLIVVVVDCLFIERCKFLWISLTSLWIMSFFLYIWELGHTASV
ncbi:hypothetical protein MKW92_043823 [Papaver armeniacum]|nr:hypothetical protein MKW92_043823 [Papaver armeniacum]